MIYKLETLKISYLKIFNIFVFISIKEELVYCFTKYTSCIIICLENNRMIIYDEPCRRVDDFLYLIRS